MTSTTPPPSRRDPLQATAEQLPDERVSGWRLLLALGMWAVIAGALGTITLVGFRTVAPTGATSDLPILLTVAEVYATLLLALVIAFGGATGLRTRLAFRAVPARAFGHAIAMWGVFLLAVVLVAVGQSMVTGTPLTIVRALLLVGSDYGRLARADGVAMLLVLARACVLAPLAEELLFRGALFGWIRQHCAASLTILITAALFAAVHMDVQIMPFAFVLGIGTGLAREHIGSTLPLFVAHAVNNVALVIAAFIVTGWTAPI